ncbi:rhamnulokinase [Testudinibacter aquarius]|uniref:Rhamnulokinase n=1 Tax=Testudinibacter aquarius TaxID=1524974 RepID=A0A4R3XYA4_9PAST|nr:rhamnulokinase [Testudinibacter aquarius]KAE9526465.1 rhamnulokinase [Testudinibacter aquarius]TCV84785.1 L-rhamnulokinase [Testudinibacter aquarius]TNG91653.1 rhamnulokinase [Testudinibacter aquarius]
MVNLNIAAIDLGASSGRVMLATYQVENQQISLQEIHRFKNQLNHRNGHDCWDLSYLEHEIITGLNKIIGKDIVLHSIGIDTWGVDYVLLNKHGEILGDSYAYRDARTEGIMPQVQQNLSKEKIYQKTGIQFLTFNTLYQLKAMMNDKPNWLEDVTDFIMVPDYLNYRLTGVLNREYTNATTTQLVNVNTDNWDTELLDYLNIPVSWFGQIRHPGHKVGNWQQNDQIISVMSVASHDTASAVIASPLSDEYSAYLCSGTWSLMGLDRKQVCNDSHAMHANITNEGGIDGHYRILKNIMGLWLFQRLCTERQITDIPALVQQASQEQAFRSLINPNNAVFLNPNSMVEAIQQYCQLHNQPTPTTTAQLARCIFDSLAMLYRQVAEELAKLQHHPISHLHIVGGGSQNTFLNQLCADICGIDVIAGPIEASVLGNIGCQLMALDQIHTVKEFRNIVTKNFPLKHFKFQPHFANSDFVKRKWQEFSQLN